MKDNKTTKQLILTVQGSLRASPLKIPQGAAAP